MRSRFQLIVLATAWCLLMESIGSSDTSWLHDSKAYADTAVWAIPGAPFDVRHGAHWNHCSVGYPMIDNQGNHYFLTARQCFFDEDGKMIDPTTEKGDLVYPVRRDRIRGSAVGFGYMHLSETKDYFYDVELVKLYPNATIDYGGYRQIHRIENDPHDIKKGDQVCMIGRFESSPSCGPVNQINLSPPYRGYIRRVRDLDIAGYCGDRNGDSGGAVFDDRGAVGIHVGGIHKNNDEHTCVSAFTPIIPILNAFRVKIPSLRLATLNNN